MTSKFYLLSILSVLLIISCNKKGNEIKKETEISGDIFIVTKGAGNYKLGLVKVSAIPEEIIQQYINNKKLQRGNEILQSKQVRYESANSYFEDVNFPQGVATTTTDAEGKFTLKLPKFGRYALAARAERSVINKTEEYNWLVWINASDSNPNNIKLSNDNLTDANSLDSLIKTY